MSYYLRKLPQDGATVVKADKFLMPGRIRPISLTSEDLSPELGYDVFLLAGQSNMAAQCDGALESHLDPLHPDILQWGQDDRVSHGYRLQHPSGTYNKPSIGLSFAHSYLSVLKPGRKILLVPCAWPGSGFFRNAAFDNLPTTGGEFINKHWNVQSKLDGDDYNENLTSLAIRRTNLAMAYHPFLNHTPQYTGTTPPPKSPYNEFKGILWHQGENNTTNYKDLLAQLITHFRTRITGASDATPFICGYFTKSHLNSVPATESVVVLPQVEDRTYFPVANCFFADSRYPTQLDEDGPTNAIHFSAAALREYGIRYFERYLAFVTGVKPSSVSASATYNNGIDVSWSSTPTSNVLTNVVGVDVSFVNSFGVLAGYRRGNPSGSFRINTVRLPASTTSTVRLTPRALNGVLGDPVSIPVTVPGTSLDESLMTNLETFVSLRNATIPKTDVTSKTILSIFANPAAVRSARGNVISLYSGTAGGSVSTNKIIAPSYSKCVWVYPRGAGLNGAPVIAGYGTNAVNYHYIRYGPGGNVMIASHNPAGYSYNGPLEIGAPAPRDEWAHWAVTYDNTAAKLVLYKNGQEVNAITNTGLRWNSSYPNTGNSVVVIGGVTTAGDPNNFANCFVDNVRLYSRVLSPDEVARIYAVESTVLG